MSSRDRAQREKELEEFFANAEDVLEWHPDTDVPVDAMDVDFALPEDDESRWRPLSVAEGYDASMAEFLRGILPQWVPNEQVQAWLLEMMLGANYVVTAPTAEAAQETVRRAREEVGRAGWQGLSPDLVIMDEVQVQEMDAAMVQAASEASATWAAEAVSGNDVQWLPIGSVRWVNVQQVDLDVINAQAVEALMAPHGPECGGCEFVRSQLSTWLAQPPASESSPEPEELEVETASSEGYRQPGRPEAVPSGSAGAAHAQGDAAGDWTPSGSSEPDVGGRPIPPAGITWAGAAAEGDIMRDLQLARRAARTYPFITNSIS